MCKHEKMEYNSEKTSMKVNFHTEFVGQMCMQACPLDPCLTNWNLVKAIDKRGNDNTKDRRI